MLCTRPCRKICAALSHEPDRDRGHGFGSGPRQESGAVKQHLRIKAFFGTNENAVKTQIWIAISVYVLVAIVKKRLAVEASLYTILQILSLTLFEKTPIDQLLNDADPQNLDQLNPIQLTLFD